MTDEKNTLPQSKRIVIAIAFSILSGALLFLAYPPVNFWPLIFVAIVPYALAQFRFMPRKWAPLAPTITMTLFLWPYLARIFGIPGAPFFFRHMGLLFGIVTLFTSTERRFHEITRYRYFVLQGIFAWVGFEMIRGLIPVLGTIGFVGNTLASQAWLIQPISIFSIYGLNLLIILVNYSLAFLALRWVDMRYKFEDSFPVDPIHARRWALICLAVSALWVAGSLVMYQIPLESPTVRIAALHNYFDAPGHQADDTEQASRVASFSEQAREAARQGAEVIFIPEMAFGFDPQTSYTEEFRALAAETNAYLYITYAYHEENGWHNETVLLSPDGEFTNQYGKLHAFGEPRTVSSGTFPVQETPLGTLGSIICMDGVFTDAARFVTRNHAQLLAIPSYNTTVGISEHNWTHFLMRSVENRVPVINTDRGLVSMVTDARGKILAFARTPKGGSELLVANIPLGTGSSPYHFLGDWLGWVSLGGFIFFNIFQMVIEKRAKNEKKEILKKSKPN